MYDVIFKGKTTYVLRDVENGGEVCVYAKDLKSLFSTYTKEMAKQAKYSEDLGTLASVTSEIRKLLDGNYVICHAKANSDIKGLVEYTIMLGESK